MRVKTSPATDMFVDTLPISQNAESRLLASKAGMDSTTWELEITDTEALPELKSQFESIAQETSYPNIFFESGFLSASHTRLGFTEKKLLTLSETLGDSKKVKLYAPIVQTRMGLPGHTVLKIWSHEFAPLSSPQIAGDDPNQIANIFCELLFLAEVQSAKAIVFADLPTNHVLARALQNNELTKNATKISSTHQRASLLPRPSELYRKEVFTKKQDRELSRQWRKLQEYGNVEFEVAQDFMTAILRFEEFLLLEVKGWKGGRGTSMHSIKRTASFARQAMANLVQQEKCSIMSLRVNDKAVSSLIVLRSGNYVFPWKMAYDESYRPLSVGKQLMVLASEHFLSTPGFEFGDSLAAPDNELMNKLWPERLKLCDMVVGVGHNPAANAVSVSRALSRNRRARSSIKGFAKKLGLI